LDIVLNKYLTKMGIQINYALHSNALQILVYSVPAFFANQM
jgi:hypothetical protein